MSFVTRILVIYIISRIRTGLGKVRLAKDSRTVIRSFVNRGKVGSSVQKPPHMYLVRECPPNDFLGLGLGKRGRVMVW